MTHEESPGLLKRRGLNRLPIVYPKDAFDLIMTAVSGGEQLSAHTP
jgi:hypothetical protein